MSQQCRHCAALPGEFHKADGDQCDMEECPFCHEQLLGCDCCYEKLGLDPEIDLTDEQCDQWDAILREKGLIPYGKETRFERAEQYQRTEIAIRYALLSCRHPSFVAWARSWRSGKRTQKQACLVFEGATDADTFWKKYPDAQVAYTAARVLSDLIEDASK